MTKHPVEKALEDLRKETERLRAMVKLQMAIIDSIITAVGHHGIHVEQLERRDGAP